MPPTLSDQLTVEKTPSYFVTKDAPRRVHLMSPGVKLIIVVRDPVTRAISDYAQAKSKKNDLLTFDELVFQYGSSSPLNSSSTRLKTRRRATSGGDRRVVSRDVSPLSESSPTYNSRVVQSTPTSLVAARSPEGDNNSAVSVARAVATKWGAVRIGMYAKHLERWLAYFGKSQIHFVHGERLVVDPAGELALLQDFLGLERFITDRFFYFDSVKGFPCLRVRPNSSYTWPSYDTSRPAPVEIRPYDLSGGYDDPTHSSLDSVSSASEPDEHLSAQVETIATLTTPTPSIDDTKADAGSQTRAHCLGKTKGRAHPVVSQATIDTLRRFYRPYNERFFRMTGTNFGWS